MFTAKDLKEGTFRLARGLLVTGFMAAQAQGVQAQQYDVTPAPEGAICPFQYVDIHCEGGEAIAHMQICLDSTLGQFTHVTQSFMAPHHIDETISQLRANPQFSQPEKDAGVLQLEAAKRGIAAHKCEPPPPGS